MRAIVKKLLRDLWKMRGQALAIAVVIVSGVATFIAFSGTMDALKRSQQAFYDETRFGDAFASLKRAPNDTKHRLQSLSGVAAVQTRVVADARLDVANFDEPITGRLISLPEQGEPVLNDLVVQEGRLPRIGRGAETAVSEVFAEAHDLQPGDEIVAIINGHRRSLTIVGIVLSPEYVYQIQPGSLFPSGKRFGVLWMPRSALAAAYDMEGAFNDISFTFAAGAPPQSVLDRVDHVLAPYGGRDAYLRADQVSHRYLTEELRGLEQFTAVLPLIFLGVAVFLLNVVIGRIIQTQREEIATLKAFGYGSRTIGLHYMGMVLIIVLSGVAVGLGLGAWMGRELAGFYLSFFRLPELHYSLGATTLLIAVGTAVGTALVGTFYAVRQAVTLQPAQAMQPPSPAVYRETILEKLGLQKAFDQPTRMILRHLERRPLKATLSVVGMAMAVAILISGSFSSDALDVMLDVQFNRSQRQDLTVTFTQPTSSDALYEIAALQGVQRAEPFRSVPVRLRNGHRSHRTGIEGLDAKPVLRRPLNRDLAPIKIPPAGLMLTDYLANVLSVEAGDSLRVTVLEGSRSTRTVPVAGRTKQFIGVGAYMQIDALNRLVREGRTLSGAYLAVDGHRWNATVDALNDRPRVASVDAQARAMQSFLDTMGTMILTMTFFMTLFAGAIAFGVVYNAARITLSERSRELASLRVLGLTRGEIGYILLGELSILTLAAIPVGFVLGWGLSYAVVAGFQTELYRFPLVIHRSSYALAAATVLGAALISGAVIWRRLGRLDLIEVLKSRE